MVCLAGYLEVYDVLSRVYGFGRGDTPFVAIEFEPLARPSDSVLYLTEKNAFRVFFLLLFVGAA